MSEKLISKDGQHLESDGKGYLTQADVRRVIIDQGDRDYWYGPLVGQENARRRLIEAITQSPEGTVIIVSSPIGTGKSSLMRMVWDDLVTSGKMRAEEVRRINAFNFGKGDEEKEFDSLKWGWGWILGEGSNKTQKIPSKAVFVEEFDEKQADLEHLQDKMRVLKKFLGREIPVMVLIGDNTLRNSELIDELGSLHEPVIIDPDPITPDFLMQFIKSSLERGLKRELSEEQVKNLFEPDFLERLIGKTQPPVANMRATLYLLQYIATEFDSQGGEPARFSKESYLKYAEKTGDKNYPPLFWQIDQEEGDVRELITVIHSLVRKADEEGVPLQPFTLDDLLKHHTLGANLSEQAHRTVDELIDKVLIYSVGVPFANGAGKHPEPYLPTQSTILEAIYGPHAEPSQTQEQRTRRLKLEKEMGILARDYLEDMNQRRRGVIDMKEYLDNKKYALDMYKKGKRELEEKFASQESERTHVNIRPATLEDIPQIEESLRKSWEMHLQEEPGLFDEERLRSSDIESYYKKALTNKDCVVLIAEKDGQFAGFIRAEADTIQPWFKHNKILWLDDIYVKEEFRREGVARSLVQQAEQAAREKGIKRVQSRVYVFNKPIQELLRSMGYDFPHRVANKVLD